MRSCTLHFSAVEQIKLSATVSVVICKMVFLPRSLALSMPHWDIYWSLELMTFSLSSLPACLLCLHIIIPFSPLVFCFLSCVWTLSSHSSYIYTQITFVSLSFIYVYIYSFYFANLFICFWGKSGSRYSDSTLSNVRAYSVRVIEMIEWTVGLWELCSTSIMNLCCATVF